MVRYSWLSGEASIPKIRTREPFTGLSTAAGTAHTINQHLSKARYPGKYLLNLFEMMAKERGGAVAQRTLMGYRGNVTRYIVPRLGGVQVQSKTTGHV